MRKLTLEEAMRAIEPLDGWTIEEERWLRKRYRFPAFMKGIAFVQTIAELSEQVNHHPLIAIDYKVVTLRLTSWRMKGITDLDVDLIKKYDDIYRSMIE